MPEGLPRPLVDELLTRWDLSKLKLVVVEGPADKRLIKLVQGEDYCSKEVADLDVWPVEAIEVPLDLLKKHGLDTSGAKQRVVAFSKEVSDAKRKAGFRGVVDKDLDDLVPVNHSSDILLYTDHSCMESYLWTPEVLGRLIIQFKAEANLPKGEIGEIYSSINFVCRNLTAVRLASVLLPEAKLEVHYSDKSISFDKKRVNIDLAKYIAQCKQAKGFSTDIKKAVTQALDRFKKIDELDLINGHDLVWILASLIKNYTKAPKRTIEEDVIAGSLVAWGILDPTLLEKPMFSALTSWAKEPV